MPAQNLKKTLIYNILIAVLVLIAFFLQENPAKDQNIQVLGEHINNEAYEVVSITDGDTLKIKVSENEDAKIQTIRLIAVNTPEIHHPTKPVECFGNEAKVFLENLLKDKKVKIETEPKDSDKDKYGRYLRYLFLEDGTNINEAIIKNGYGYEATYVNGYKYQKLFKDAQNYAEQNKLGLWNESTCNGSL